MNTRILAAALATAALSPIAAQAQTAAPASAAPATQQAAVAPTVGAKVYGPDGVEAGTVEKVDAANAVVNTGTKRATLPLAAFGKNEKGLLVSMTREQLDAAVEAATAKAAGNLDQALVAGAALHSADGAAMGKISSVSPEGIVTVEREGGSFALKKDMFTTDAQGVALKLTAAQIQAALAKQQQASASTPAAQP